MKRVILVAAAAMLLLTGCTPNNTNSSTNSTPHELPPQITQEMLTQRGVKVEQDSSGTVLYLTGSTQDAPVENADDAMQAVASLSDLLCCGDVYNELRFEAVQTRVGLDVYMFQQYYADLPVEGCGLTLTANADTHQIDSIRSSYAAGIQLNTEPSLSASDAKKAAKKELPRADGLHKPQLAVANRNGDFRLIWLIEGEDSERLELDANTGEVLYAFDGAFPD